MSVHFRNTCTVIDDIECKVPRETKWNRTQPQLVMRDWAKDVLIKNNKATII